MRGAGACCALPSNRHRDAPVPPRPPPPRAALLAALAPLPRAAQAQGATAAGAVAAAAEPDAAARAEILATLDRVTAAMRARDTAALRAEFLPGARLVGMRARASGDTVVQTLTEQEFAAFVARDARPEWTERLWEPEVRVAGTLATVWAAYDFHFGGTFSHCGVDAFHLLRVQGRWRIAGIADTYERSGCPPRPAPEARRP